ncbi:MAG: AMP-binding protein [Candidatus Babeliales bacterium]
MQTYFFEKLRASLYEQGRMIHVSSILERTAQKYPDHCALECNDQSLTYHQLHQQAMLFGALLRERNVRINDRVVLIYENSIEFYIAYFGIWHIGAIVAPLNTFLHERELVHIINDAKPTAIVMSEPFERRFAALKEKDFNGIACIGDADMQKIRKHSETVPLSAAVYREPDELVALLYTSGTTGFPKGVMLSSRNILTNLAQGLCLIAVDKSDKVLAALPLFHSFAQWVCVWAVLFVGGTVIIVPRIERKSLLDGLRRFPTFIVGVPALYGLFCLMKQISFDTVRYFVCGGDALPDKIRIGFELLYRRRLCNGYGLTEASPFVAINFDDLLLQPNTVGRLAQGLQCKLLDEQGNAVAPGNKGVLWVKGENIMLGYYNAPEATQAVLKDGWLDTGDWAFLDDEQRLVIAGRSKDLIVHKGIKIYPPEIENILLSDGAVVQAAVVGQHDESVGEIPVAFVVLKEGALFDEMHLKAVCQSHLAAYKVPRAIYHVPAHEWPMTPLKKANKNVLRTWLVSGFPFGTK